MTKEKNIQYNTLKLIICVYKIEMFNFKFSYLNTNASVPSEMYNCPCFSSP